MHDTLLETDFNSNDVSRFCLAQDSQSSFCFPPSSLRHCRTFTQTPPVSGLISGMETSTELPGMETSLKRHFVLLHEKQHEDKSLSLSQQ